MKDQIAHKRLNAIWMQSFCPLCKRCFLSCCPERIYLGDYFNTNICNFLYKHLLVPLVVSTFTLTSLSLALGCEYMEKCRTHPLESKDLQVPFFMELFPTLLSHAVDQCDLSYLYEIKFCSYCLQCLLWHQNIGVPSCPVLTSVLKTDMLC